MAEERIVCGARCLWWDSIDKAASRGIPVCPFCGSPLYEFESEESWFRAVRKHEENGSPGYTDFIRWLRGKCFPTTEKAQLQYQAEKKEE